MTTTIKVKQDEMDYRLKLRREAAPVAWNAGR